MNLNRYKYEYDGIKFMSQPEINFYKLLKRNNIEFEYQPKPIIIEPAFTAASGKKYQAMKYEPDFLIETNIMKVYIEVKGANDLVYTKNKKGELNIKNNADIYRLKHKIVDKAISANNDVFLVVRDAERKNRKIAGMFWEKDFEQLKKYKTQKLLNHCERVPRIIERLGSYFIHGWID